MRTDRLLIVVHSLPIPFQQQPASTIAASSSRTQPLYTSRHLKAPNLYHNLTTTRRGAILQQSSSKFIADRNWQSLSTPYIHYSSLQILKANRSTMATATSTSNDDYRSKGQQSPLASQRAKQGSQPTEGNRTAKFNGYFPLGYKAGFSQWVCG